jgi:hypothetical protein
MENHSAEEAKKKYDSLPQEVKSLLYSPQMSFVIQQIGTKNKLHLDQIDLLNNETGQFMLGFIQPKDFPDALKEMLSVDKDQADTIVSDINEMLLTPIREAMKIVHTDPSQKILESTPIPTVTTSPLSEGKSVVMPSSVAKSVGAEVAHSTPAVTPIQTTAAVPPITVPAPAAATLVTPQAEAAMMPTIIKPSGVTPAPKIDTMLSEPTVNIAPLNPAFDAGSGDRSAKQNDVAKPADATKVEPPKPGPIYKTDPYHEPID